MMDKETYKRELVRMWDSLRDTCYHGLSICQGVSCRKCPIIREKGSPAVNCGLIYALDNIGIVEKWSKEHPEPKYKVSKMEYDILDMFINDNSEIDYVFNNLGDKYMSKLLEKGYFKGAEGNMSIRYYFSNCGIVDDN